MGLVKAVYPTVSGTGKSVKATFRRSLFIMKSGIVLRINLVSNLKKFCKRVDKNKLLCYNKSEQKCSV